MLISSALGLMCVRVRTRLCIIKAANISRHTLSTDVPRATGVSGVVEPLQQLGVRGHAHFDQVGVGLHPESPEVPAK